MKAQIQKILGESKSKMNGYVMLLTLRYANLCVKADAMALLPVTVVVDGEEMNIEAVADVAMLNDYVIAVSPKDPQALFDIGKGVMLAHPEFKMDVVQNEDGDKEEDKYLTFTMPEVDKDRHDALNDGVDTLYNQCKAKIDGVLAKSGELIIKAMEGFDPQTVDTIKDELQNLHDFFDNTLKQMTDAKKQEIAEAYQQYQDKQNQEAQQQQEQDQAHGEGIGMSMKFED